ncbi:hypothetical protein [Haliangium sp.]|uniref:hypothetical protein n=1 Tax=Haliangium sp. TaxID=2663208 RepID=UPI003D136A87
MPLRSSLCSHCQRQPPVTPCAHCGRMVCADCSADEATCAAPRARSFRIGFGRSLHQFDPTGELALVASWFRRQRVFDLLRRRHVADAVTLPYSRVPLSPIVHNRLVAWAWTELQNQGGSNGSMRRFRGLNLAALPRGEVRRVENHRDDDFELPIDLRLSSSGRVAWFSTRSETIRMWSLDGKEQHEHTPLRAAVIQSADFDDGADLLFTATYGYAAVHRVAGPELVATGRIRLPDSDNPWLAGAGGRVVVISDYRGDRGHELSAFALDHEGAPAHAPFYTWSEHDPLPINMETPRIQHPIVATLGPDGRYVALALEDGRLAVHDLDRTTVRYLRAHGRGVTALRFSKDAGSLLSTNGRRVIIRPRRGDEFLELARARG